MKTPNPVVIQIKNTTDADILARIDYYLNLGSLIGLKQIPKLSAHKDESEKNKFIIEETLNINTLPVQNKIYLGYIILRVVNQQMRDIYEVEIFRSKQLPRACKGGAFLIHLATALCEDFELVDPSKKIVIPAKDPNDLLFSSWSQEEMEPGKNTVFLLGGDDRRINYANIQNERDSNLPAVEKKNTNTTVQVPKRFADKKKWKVIYKKIRGWYPSLSYNMISDKLRNDKSVNNYPTSPDTIAKIIAAGDNGLLDEE